VIIPCNNDQAKCATEDAKSMCHSRYSCSRMLAVCSVEAERFVR